MRKAELGVAVVVSATVGLAGGVGWAAVRDANGVIHGC